MKNRAEGAARIFLIDDHSGVREGLKLLLSQESHLVCGESTSRGETLERIGQAAADMAVLDLSLGGESGFELIAELRKLGVSVLVYSMHENADIIKRAFTAGVNGYVTKHEVADDFLAAVSDVLAGKRHVSPRAAQSLANRALSLPAAANR